MKKVKTKVIRTRSSGNVFKDLVVSRSDEAFEAAKVISKLAQRIAKRGLDGDQAAAIIGIDTQQLMNVLGGQRKGFSLKQLKKLVVDFEASFGARATPPDSAATHHQCDRRL